MLIHDSFTCKNKFRASLFSRCTLIELSFVSNHSSRNCDESVGRNNNPQYKMAAYKQRGKS